MNPGKFYVGLSGFSYPSWRGEGRFYPQEIGPSKFLAYYTSRYCALEMDGTFYKNPTENAVSEWIKKTPEHFKFSFKMHQRVTHLARLKPESLESVKFMLGRLLPLAKVDRLGPLLIQLPPNFKRNDERLGSFLAELPRDFGGVEGGSGDLKARYAIEFRNDTWNDPVVEGMLREQGIGWVAAETDDTGAQRRDTGPCAYARLRKSEYSEAALTEWAKYFRSLTESGKDVFVYCKHEDEGAPWVWADFLLRCGL